MIVHHAIILDNAGITFLAHSHATILHWINILLRHYAAMLNQHLCAPCKNRLFLRRFVFCMAEASAKRVTGDEPQGAMGRVQTPGEATSRPLSPFRLPLRARFKERRLGTRQVLLVNQPYFLHLLYCKLFPKETDLTLVGSQNKKRSFSN